MLGWLTDSLDAATTQQVLQALATFVLSTKPIMAAALLGLTGLAAPALAQRIKSSPRRRLPLRGNGIPRALAAYAAQLPSNALRIDFDVEAARAALTALAAQRKNASKAQRERILEALYAAAFGDFALARGVFEDIVEKEEARWRRQRPKLAAAVRHAGTLARIKDPDEALVAFAHACDLEPTNETSLMMLSKLMIETGRPNEAEPILDRLIHLSERASNPHGLVYGLIFRGDSRVSSGKLALAAIDYERASEICRGQPQSEAPDIEWQRPLALAQGRLGGILLRQDKPSQAFERFETAHRIHEELGRAAPTNLDALRDLSGSCDRIGDFHLAQGDLEAAFKTFCDARGVGQRLADSNPGHTELQRDFAVSCSRVGEVLRTMRRYAEALEAFRSDLAISSRLAEAAPADARRQRDLAVSYANVGDMLCALGAPQEALVSFEAARKILEPLSEASPDDEARAHELALMHTRVGTACAKLNRYEDALEAFESVLADAIKRAHAVPQDASRQRDLAQAHTRIGTLHLDAAKLEDAVSSFDLARKVVEGIAEPEVESIELRRELALCHGRIALARARSDARDDALEAFQAGHSLLAGLNGGSEVLVADDKAWFAGQIAALEVTHPFTLQPLRLSQKSSDAPEEEAKTP